MPNKLRLCTGCKKRFELVDMFKTPAGYFHSFECASGLAKIRADKKAAAKKKKIDAEFDRNFYENDIKTREAAAKKVCHLYIRARDKDDRCICCGMPLGDNYHAGHFLESGNNSKLRFHQDNIHGQNLQCNFFKGGDSGDYERRLRIKIGDDRVDWLLANKGGVMKRTAQDYKDIENYYKGKLNDLQNQSGFEDGN